MKGATVATPEQDTHRENKGEIQGAPIRLASADFSIKDHSGYGQKLEEAGGKAALSSLGENIGSAGESGKTELPSLIPQYRHNSPPRYPLIARLRGHEGVVLISAKINVDGTVAALQLKKSSGYPVLDKSAFEAVRSWKFEPGRKMGVPVPMWVDIPVRFSLNEG